MEGRKVLHMDRNDYYGGSCASLNLSQVLFWCLKRLIFVQVMSIYSCTDITEVTRLPRPRPMAETGITT